MFRDIEVLLGKGKSKVQNLNRSQKPPIFYN